MENLKKSLAELFSLREDSASMNEIVERIHSGAILKGTNMCILVLAIFIASIGLNMNSTAVIIGAMLISPLMGNIIAIGYGMAAYDAKYVKNSFLKLVFQVFLSILTSAIYFSLTPITNPSSELLARTVPTIWDVLIAIFGGIAGIIGLTREERGNVIPGVAIATALMPPLFVLHQQLFYLFVGVCSAENPSCAVKTVHFGGKFPSTTRFADDFGRFNHLTEPSHGENQHSREFAERPDKKFRRNGLQYGHSTCSFVQNQAERANFGSYFNRTDVERR